MKYWVDGMTEKIEIAFRDLISALQVAKLYTAKHPYFAKFLDTSINSITEVLNVKDSFVLGVVGEELVYEKEIFFDLSKNSKAVIAFLKERGIEKIGFTRGLQKEELIKLIEYMCLTKEEVNKTIEEYLELSGVKNIFAGKITISEPSSNVKSASKSSNFSDSYTISEEKTTQVLNEVLNTGKIDALSLKFVVQNFMEKFTLSYLDILKLVVVKRYSLGTYTHNLNVSILSLFFASRLQYSKEDVMEIAVAALFHDIGKVYISNKILAKPGELTQDELSKIRSHTILGAEIMLNYVDTLGVLPVIVAYEHHLKYNGEGYPKMKFTVKPQKPSMIVSICDVYDALYQKRDYKHNYSPEAIYNLMMKEKGISFEPNLLEEFFKIFGIWPIGSIVTLSDERIAVVRQQNENDLWSPKVEVIVPQERKETIDLSKEKDKIKINYALDAWGAAQNYMHLI